MDTITVMNADSLRESLNAHRPLEAVQDYRIETGTDSTGDPAVWVFVVVDDSRLDDVWPIWDQLRQDVREAVAGVVGSDVMVYVRMWSAAELVDAVPATGSRRSRRAST